jgi:hypothetical protein
MYTKYFLASLELPNPLDFHISSWRLVVNDLITFWVDIFQSPLCMLDSSDILFRSNAIYARSWICIV